MCVIFGRGVTAKMHLGIRGHLEDRTGESVEVMRTGESLDDLERAFDALKYGEFSEQPILDVVVPSMEDPKLAPADHHVVSVMVHFAPYDLRAGWGDEQKQLLEERVLKVLETNCPGVRDRIVASELLTPQDIETRYGAVGGHIFHAEHAPDQLLFMRPTIQCAQYRTPVPGLYLCGSGSHPGGGMTGMPGLLGARAILSARLNRSSASVSSGCTQLYWERSTCFSGASRYCSEMSLLSNFITVMTGRLAAQVIMVVAMPVLARIFLPEHFGVISLLTSLTQIPMALAHAALRTGFTQCESDEEAGALVGVCLRIALPFLAVMTVLTFVFAPWMAKAFSAPELGWFVPVLPLMLAAQTMGVLGKQWAAYRERFMPVAVMDGLSTMARRVVPIPLGLTIFPSSSTGMFIGFVLAPVTSAVIMMGSFFADLRQHVRFRAQFTGPVARKYRNFPIHLSGVTLLDMLSLAAPAFILGLYWSMTEVGWFGQAFALLTLPVSLLTQAAARTFYPRLAKAHQNGEDIGGLIGRLLKAVVDLGFYPLCALAVLRLMSGRSFSARSSACLATWDA